MAQIHKLDLVNFQPENKEHLKTMKNSIYFDLYSNTELFVKMLETTDFKKVDIDKDDFKTHIYKDKCFLSIDITDNFDFDDHHYLFDAFNVYYASNNFSYYRVHKTLTKAWRKILKDTYSNTTYPEDLKKVLKKELKDIVEKFNKDNVDLLY